MTHVAQVNLVFALAAELRPLTRHLKLTQVAQHPFQIYAGERIRAIVSGVGRESCAAAIGFCAGCAAARPSDVWINIGIAGHRELELGTPVIAHKVESASSGATWYPSLLFTPPCRTGNVRTHDEPVTAYPPDACCDMEASAFCATAGHVARADLIQVLKVISDNACSGLENIDRERIADLMSGQQEVVSTTIERLRSVAATLPLPAPEDAVQRCCAQWHFTVTQRAQLRHLNARHHALQPTVPWPWVRIEHCHSASAVIETLENYLNAIPPLISGDDRA